MHRVTFILKGESARVVVADASTGETLIETAHAAGIELPATCGGRGACRSCRVKILQGLVPPATAQDRTQLGAEAVKELFRLSCQTKVVAPCTVLVAPSHIETGHQILGPREDGFPAMNRALDCGIEKYVVEIEQSPDLSADKACVERLISALPLRVSAEIPLEVLRCVPRALNSQTGIATVTVANGAVIDVEAGDTSACKYGAAFDIGTTTIVGTLLDLDSGERFASVSKVNPQSVYGGDLMSRITVVQVNPDKLNTLRAVALNALNDFINEVTRKFGIDPRHLYKVTVVGNSCMHHIMLGIDVTTLGLAPYSPVVRAGLQITARELALKSAPRSSVYFLPLVAGFVGADTVGAVLATGVHQGNETRLLVDIGTNTEVVISADGRMVACSAPAGPAFEGGEIRHGMRAAVGAIESVEIKEDVRCRVIGDVAPVGICGSGLIDAVAKMLDAGLIEPSGVFCQGGREALPAALRARFRDSDEGTAEFVLVSSEVSGTGEDITITQSDIRQLQLAKGAVYSAIVMLQRVTGIEDAQIRQLFLCGGFGNYIDVTSAIRIRMLPPLPTERVQYVGNAAHVGAEMVLLSKTAQQEAERLVRRIEHVSLADHPDFQNVFVEAIAI